LVVNPADEVDWTQLAVAENTPAVTDNAEDTDVTPVSIAHRASACTL
jgi:hypothetical protein